MKTTKAKSWTAVLGVVLTAAAFSASADQGTTAARPEKCYTGTIVSVDPNEHVLAMKSWMWHKSFNLGDTCTYKQLDNPTGTVSDLRPGEKVSVSYQDAHGVLIADRVKQEPMQFAGMVKAIDPDKQTLTLHRQGLNKQLQLADGCKIVLHGDKPGTFADIRPGDHVTVTFETPGGTPTAREIAQTSITFTGELTAIDLGEKTLKARTLLDSKRFNVADNCAIVIQGRTDGRLSDLKPDEKLVLNYDEINGVNVATRIAPAEEGQANTEMNTTAPMAGN